MARSWGFGPTAITTFLTVSTVWNVLGRILFGLVGMAIFVMMGNIVQGTVLAILLTLLGVTALAVALLASKQGSALVGQLLGRLSALLDRRGRNLGARAPAAMAKVRRSSLAVARRSWVGLSGGIIGYFALLCVLLDLCLRAVGAPQPLVVVLTVVALERLLTALPITPGALGIAELGLTTFMSALGVDPVLAGAAALVYRGFTFALEIPFGLLVAAGWRLRHRGRSITDSYNTEAPGASR
jgi:uncharacterized protein (TIRG00374 family)